MIVGGLAVFAVTSFAFVEVVENQLLTELIILDWQQEFATLDFWTKYDVEHDPVEDAKWARANVGKLVRSQWHDVVPGPGIAFATSGALVLLGVVLWLRTNRDAPHAANPIASASAPIAEATAARALRAAGAIQIVSAVGTAIAIVAIGGRPAGVLYLISAFGIPMVIMQAAAFMVGVLVLIAAASVRLPNRGLPILAARALLLPLTPAWLITAPLAIWVLSLLRQDKSN
jgi:hypothetical protein